MFLFFTILFYLINKDLINTQVHIPTFKNIIKMSVSIPMDFTIKEQFKSENINDFENDSSSFFNSLKDVEIIKGFSALNDIRQQIVLCHIKLLLKNSNTSEIPDTFDDLIKCISRDELSSCMIKLDPTGYNDFIKGISSSK